MQQKVLTWTRVLTVSRTSFRHIRSMHFTVIWLLYSIHWSFAALFDDYDHFIYFSCRWANLLSKLDYSMHSFHFYYLCQSLGVYYTRKLISCQFPRSDKCVSVRLSTHLRMPCVHLRMCPWTWKTRMCPQMHIDASVNMSVCIRGHGHDAFTQCLQWTWTLPCVT